MNNAPMGRARRAASEFFVIVVGVLVALWIDAGWGWLEDRGDERALLRDLQADFEVNLDEIRTAAVRRATTSNLGSRLVRDGISGFSPDSLDAVVMSVYQVWTLNPRMGALESSISAGRIDLIRNDELRSALTSWAGYFEDAEEETRLMMPHVVDLYVATSSSFLRNASSQEMLELMLNDPELTGVVAMVASAYGNTAAELEDLAHQTQRVLGLLEAELAGAS